MTASAALAELTRLVQRAHVLGSVGGLLGWDEQVNLPPGAAGQRAEQHAVLAEVIHAAVADPRVGELLAVLEDPAAGLDADGRAVVRDARRDHDHATRLPAAFVREKAAHESRAFHVWARARTERDFAAFRPALERNVAFAREEAAFLGGGAEPYDRLLDKFDPGLTAAVVERLFAELRRDLVPLVREIAASPRAARARGIAAGLRGFPVDAQATFLREVTARIGFDYQRGRLDVSVHPFCSGTGSDVRLTTRYREDQPLSALFGSVHEAGHGLYEQGLPAAHLGTALGRNAGMAVHESQSRLWENQVARGRGFWRHFGPRWRELFPAQTAGLGDDDLLLAVNPVAPTLIRVEADELTYNLHILLRFELERRLLSGSLAAADLPGAWRALSAGLLGLEPAHDGEGVLQDVHWSGGMFGYFPSYCLGNMIAAQLWARVRALRPGLEEEFARGEFGWLLGWLREHIHGAARRHTAFALVHAVTGEELTPRHLVAYLRERYGALYLG